MSELPVVPHYPNITRPHVQLRDALVKYLSAEVRGWRVPEGRRYPYEFSRPVLYLQNEDQVRLVLVRAGLIPNDRQPVQEPVPGLLREEAEKLVRDGMLRPPDQPAPHSWMLTDRGLGVLTSDDATEALGLGTGAATARFKRDFAAVPDADTFLRYLGQAERAVEHKMDLAAAVLIGACYELALLQVADALVAKFQGGAVQNLETKLQQVLANHETTRAAGTRGPQALDLLKATHGALDALSRVKPSLVAAQKEWIQSSFVASFNDVREARNDAGHPSGEVLDLELLDQHVTRFNSDYKRVRLIIDALK